MGTEVTHASGSCLSCKGVSTRDWYAWNDRMPPRPDKFHITGEVLVPNPGVKVLLLPREPQGINPKYLLLDLLLVQQPGVWPQVQVWKPARYEKVLYGPGSGYTEADIFCETEIIQRVPVEEVS
jgi:hypothetical protein